MSFPQGHSDELAILRAPKKLETILCRRNLRLVGEVTGHASEASVVIAMPLHNQATTLRAALDSALAQKLSQGHCAVVLLDDQSTDGWQSQVADLLHHPAVIVLAAQCGNAALARNAILDFVESELPNAKWIARLDPDDRLCSDESVESLRYEGERCKASFVVGSNFLNRHGEPVYPDNIANRGVLLDRRRLTEFIDEFCVGRARNELPSCNLLIRAHEGIRYPLLKSAEDHWLVAQLLMFRTEQAAVVSYPVYCHYALKGAATTSNERSGAHRKTREFLARASKVWLAATAEAGEILGYGMEGCVLKVDGMVVKRFYPGAMTSQEMSRLAGDAIQLKGRLPIFDWSVDADGSISCRYAWAPLGLVGNHVPVSELQSFLLDFARAGIVASNIKRENLRLHQGRLIYIDIGRDICKFTPSFFLDSAARLYAICILNLKDGELTRRHSYQRQHESLNELEGFEDFYRDLVAQLHPMVKIHAVPPQIKLAAPDVTLMIKACPQDHATVTEQVAHIVSQLSRPRDFSTIVLTIDPHVGQYLRQYDKGNLQSLQKSAAELLETGIVDSVWVAPQDPVQVEALFGRWFNIAGIRETHTQGGAPSFSQLWAFERITTRYVLQCDLDVLIGRKDSAHDYMAEMLRAMQEENTWCAGFNIPKNKTGFTPYVSRPEGFVPEIRLGLLDLQKIRAHLPLPNTASGGRILKMWHRSMEDAQRINGMQTVRGGDDCTFYVHPLNEIKGTLDLPRVRDLIGQGHYPMAQAEKWDLASDLPWRYASRSEGVVFLLKGRNTPKEKLQRCLDSLLAQSDRNFGVILIDDASEPIYSWSIDEYLGPLRDRTTLIRHRDHCGYIPNFLLASQLCSDPETLIAVLDQDDVLMNTDVVTSLKRAVVQGADLVNGLMIRPDKATRLYFADYEFPRTKGGGNTWTHLRAFKKSLLDSVPIEHFMVDDEWISDVSDYATMVPMAELARRPMQLTDKYYVWHDRPVYSIDRKLVQARLITTLLTRPGLQPSFDREPLMTKNTARGQASDAAMLSAT